MKRLDRLLAMALFLSSRRVVRAEDMAERFGVSLRTVYRDVRALVGAGFPVQGNAGDGYRLSQTSYLRPLTLSPDEAEVLMMAALAFGAPAEPAMRDPLLRATSKLEIALDPSARRRVLDLQRKIAIPAFVEGRGGPMSAAVHALREGRVANVVYVAPRSSVKTSRTIEPLGLVCVGEHWWVVAYCRLRKDARAFRVDAISRWTTTDEAMAPRVGFSFAEIAKRDGHLAKRLFGS